MKDSKGRNLLHLLMRHIGSELKPNSDESAKVLQIVRLLTEKKSKKPIAALVSQESGFGLSISSVDSRGYNVLHTLAKNTSIKVFEMILKALNDSPSLLQLLSQESSHKA